MAKAKRKRLTARERGYFSRVEAAVFLRSLASRLEMEAREGATSLVRMTMNCWFTEDDELEPASASKSQSEAKTNG